MVSPTLFPGSPLFTVFWDVKKGDPGNEVVVSHLGPGLFWCGSWYFYYCYHCWEITQCNKQSTVFHVAKERKGLEIWFRLLAWVGRWGPGSTEGYHVIRGRKINDQGVIFVVRNFPGDFFRVERWFLCGGKWTFGLSFSVNYRTLLVTRQLGLICLPRLGILEVGHSV